MTVVARVEAWLFAAESPARLRVCQVGLALLVGLRLAVTPYHELAGQPAALFAPPWFLAWLTAMPPLAVILALQVVGVAAALAAALAPVRAAVTPARLRRIAFAVAWACLLVLAGLRASRGKIMHNDLLLLFVCVPFLAAPYVSAAEARLRPSRRYGWPLRAAFVVIAVAYFRAGLGKVLASGLAWVASDNMRWILLSASRQDKAPTDTVSLYIVDRPWLAMLAAGALLAVELSAPLVLVASRFRAPFAVAAVGLHIGTWLTIGLDYSAWALVVPLVLVDWPALMSRRSLSSFPDSVRPRRQRSELRRPTLSPPR